MTRADARLHWPVALQRRNTHFVSIRQTSIQGTLAPTALPWYTRNFGKFIKLSPYSVCHCVNKTINQEDCNCFSADGQYYCPVLLPWISFVQHVSPWSTQYYCALFHFPHVMQVNMLSDTDAACVAIVLALCLKSKLQQKITVHTRKPDDRRLSELKGYKNCLHLVGSSFDELLKIVAPAIANY